MAWNTVLYGTLTAAAGSVAGVTIVSVPGRSTRATFDRSLQWFSSSRVRKANQQLWPAGNPVTVAVSGEPAMPGVGAVATVAAAKVSVVMGLVLQRRS